MRHRVQFSGRVQGVGFRATARAISARFRVVGWVRNEPDGSVLLEVQGSSADVAAFLTELAATMQGRILSEHRSSLPDRPGESAFEILR
jgi:acylphosphatase